MAKGKDGIFDCISNGVCTWAWGNQLLWGYQDSMDSELQRTFNLAVENGINLFDTADSYGTGRLNGQSEKFLGKFIREFPGDIALFLFLREVNQFLILNISGANSFLRDYFQRILFSIFYYYMLLLYYVHFAILFILYFQSCFDTSYPPKTTLVDYAEEKQKMDSSYAQLSRLDCCLMLTYPWRLTRGQFVNACKSSLERMQIDQIGIGQLHWSTCKLCTSAGTSSLGWFSCHGLVRAVGVSNYGPKQLLKIHKYLGD